MGRVGFRQIFRVPEMYKYVHSYIHTYQLQHGTHYAYPRSTFVPVLQLYNLYTDFSLGARVR